MILLDVYMPGMDGYETAQIIRSREQTKRIPIVFLSAVNKETEHLLRGYSMGAVDYVFKPVEPVVLRSKVAVFVDLFVKTQEIERKARAGAGAARRQPARQCRAAARRAGAAPRRAAPGGDHRSRCRWSSISSRSRPMPARGRSIVSGDFKAITGFTFDEVRGAARALGRPAPSRRPRARARRDLRRASATGAIRSNIAGNARTANTSISSTRPCCCKDADGAPLEYRRHSARRHRPQGRSKSSCSRRSKMDAIGKLTGGIAHDFNNLLAAVLGGLGLIERRLPARGRAAARSSA